MKNAVELITQDGDFATAGGFVYLRSSTRPVSAVVPEALHLLTLNGSSDVSFEGITSQRLPYAYGKR